MKKKENISLEPGSIIQHKLNNLRMIVCDSQPAKDRDYYLCRFQKPNGDWTQDYFHKNEIKRK